MKKSDTPVLIVLLTLTSFLPSCSQRKIPRSGPLTVKVEFSKEPSMDEVGKDISSFEIIPVEYKKGLEMGPVNKITGGRDWIACQVHRDKSMWIIDYKGRIINHFIKAGKGPGEYGSVSAIGVNPDGHLVVLDHYTGKLLEFLPDGTFLGERVIPGTFESFAFLDGKYPVFGSARVFAEGDTSGLYIHLFDRDFKPESTFLPFYTQWLMGVPVPNFHSFGDGIGIEMVGDYHYYRLNANRTLDTLLVFDFGKNGFDFSNSDRMSNEDYLEIFGQNVEKPLYTGAIYPQKHTFLNLNFINGNPYVAVGAWDQSALVYHPLMDFKILGTYKGFPIPAAKEIINGKIAGALDPVDILDFWDQHPDQKKIAEKEPAFSKIIGTMKADDNPVLIFYTL